MTVSTGVPCPLCESPLRYVLGRSDRGVCDYEGCHLKRDEEGRSCVWDLTVSPPRRIPGSHANRPDGDAIANPLDVQCPDAECLHAIGIACSSFEVAGVAYRSAHDARYWAVGIPTRLGPDPEKPRPAGGARSPPT